MMIRSLLSALLIASVASAQSLHVVPASLSDVDGPAMSSLPGISTSHRMQVIIAASELQPLVGQEITGLLLRRDVSTAAALRSATAQLVVKIGSAAQPPETALRSFGGNLPAPTEAYRGTITAPVSPANPPASGWGALQTIRIDFAQRFVYPGGPLCLEFESLSSARVWWPIDAVTDTTSGSETNVGAACGRFAFYVHSAGVSGSGLVIGRTATFHLLGEPLAPAWLLLGFGILQQPIDLAVFGAPGCTLHLDPVAALPTSVSMALIGFDGSGLANVDLHMPANPGLLGVDLGAQWVEIAQGSVVTSNAMLCHIAPTPPSLAMTAVVSRAGEQPDVISAGVPVLGLLWQ